MKIDWRKWTQAVACLDLMVSTSFALVTLMVIVTIVYPVWFSDLDTSTRAGLWISFLNDMYSLKDRNVSERWMKIAVGLLLFFTFLGVVASIALITSTHLTGKRAGWAVNMTWFWIYSNVPVLLVYCMAGFMFIWCLILAIPRALYLLIVWKYVRKLEKTERQNEYEDVPGIVDESELGHFPYQRKLDSKENHETWE